MNFKVGGMCFSNIVNDYIWVTNTLIIIKHLLVKCIGGIPICNNYKSPIVNNVTHPILSLDNKKNTNNNAI